MKWIYAIILLQILSLRFDSALSKFLDGTITYNGTFALDGTTFNASILLVPATPSFINQDSTENSTEISTFLNETRFNSSILMSSVLRNQTNKSAAILTNLNGTVVVFNGTNFNARFQPVSKFPNFQIQNLITNSTHFNGTLVVFNDEKTFNVSFQLVSTSQSFIGTNSKKKSTKISTYMNGTIIYNETTFNASILLVPMAPSFKIPNLTTKSTTISTLWNGTIANNVTALNATNSNGSSMHNVKQTFDPTTTGLPFPNSTSNCSINSVVNYTPWDRTTFIPANYTNSTVNFTTNSVVNSTPWDRTTFIPSNYTNSTVNFTTNSVVNSTPWDRTTFIPTNSTNSTANFTTNSVVNSTPWDRTTFIPSNYTNSTVNFTTNSAANSSSWEITTLTSTNSTTNFTNITMSHRPTTKRFAFSDSPNPHFQTPNSTTSHFANSSFFSPKHPTTESSSVPTTPQFESTTQRSSTNTGESTLDNGFTTPTVTGTIEPDTNESNPATTTTETPKNVSKPYSVKSGFFDAIFCECSLSSKEFLTAIDHVCCINDDLQESGNQKPIHEAFLFEFNDTEELDYSLLKEQTIQELHIIDSGIYVDFIENYEMLEKVYIHNTKVRQHLLDNLVLNAIALETLYLNRVEVLKVPRNHLNRKSPPFNYQFPPESQLKVLSLINCDIHTLLGVNFAMNLTQLQMLSLAYNNLTKLDNPRFFPKNAPNFYHLDLSYNQLTILNSGSIPKTIKILNLSGNHFKQFNFEVFQHFWSTGLEFWIMDNVLNCTHYEVMPGQQNGEATFWIKNFVIEYKTSRLEIYGNFCVEYFNMTRI